MDGQEADDDHYISQRRRDQSIAMLSRPTDPNNDDRLARFKMRKAKGGAPAASQSSPARGSPARGPDRPLADDRPATPTGSADGDDAASNIRVHVSRTGSVDVTARNGEHVHVTRPNNLPLRGASAERRTSLDGQVSADMAQLAALANAGMLPGVSQSDVANAGRRSQSPQRSVSPGGGRQRRPSVTMRMTNKVTRRLMKKRESEVEHLKGPEKSIYYTERMRPKPQAGDGRSRSLPRQRPTIIDSPGELLAYVCLLLAWRDGGGGGGGRGGRR